MNILCLHGKQQNAEVLRARFGRLPQKAKGIAQFHFVDAPHELELQNANDEVAMRIWWHRESQADGSLLMTADSIDTTLQFLDEVWASGRYCGIFGFSMGGILAAIVAALPERFPGLRFVLIAGAPNERQLWLRGDVRGEDWSSSIPSHVRCLCILGQTDQVVPLQSGRTLALRFHDPRFIEHPQGHHIPTQAMYLNQYVEFLREMQAYVAGDVVERDAVRTTHSSGSSEAQAVEIAHSTTISSESSEQRDKRSFACASDEVAVSQVEEWEVLQSIYPTELQLHSTALPAQKGDPCLHFSLAIAPLPAATAGTAAPAAWEGNIGLDIALTPAYPHQADAYPVIEVTTGALTLMDGFTEAMRCSLLRDIAAAMGAADESAISNAITATSAALQPDGEAEPKLLLGIQAAFDWFADGKWKTAQAAAGGSSTSSNSNRWHATNLAAAGDAAAVAEGENDDDEGGEEHAALDGGAIDMDCVRAATEEAWRVASALSSASDTSPDAQSSSDYLGFISSESDLSKHRGNETERGLLPESARGVWPYTVGLVGKPSAGKSTFFNAVTQAALSRNARLMAAVAPHPFTTIEPNVGPGWYAAIDVDETDGSGANPTSLPPRHPIHGYVRVATTHHSLTFSVGDDHIRSTTAAGAAGPTAQSSFAWRRRLPVCVKDVAGLVPGAYKGRGKGNRFLADLCDADVLVHVVDVTGKADKDGNIVGAGEKGSNPIEDAEWIRAELHCWIFGNVFAKWHSVLRQKSEKAGEGNSKCRQRVIALFSGYQGPRWCVEVAARRAQLQLTRAFQWTAQDVHRLVAHFLSVRFPICLALNKIDELSDDDYAAVIGECQRIALSRGEVAVPVCAKAECALLLQLQQQQQQKQQQQNKMQDLVDADVVEKVRQIYGTTGVLEAISAAVRLKPPVLCFPVGELDTEYPVGWTAGKKLPGAAAVTDTAAAAAAATATAESISSSSSSSSSYGDVPRLQDCIQLKLGSTAGDAFEALKRGVLAHATVVGELVRVDGRALPAGSRKMQLSRNSVIDSRCCVLRVQTNKKSVWQAEHLRKKEQQTQHQQQFQA